MTRFNELVVRHEIAGRSRLLDVDEELRGRGRIESHILVEIQSLVVRVDPTVVVVDVGTGPGRVLAIEHGRRAADEIAGLAEHIAPPRRLERRIVDVTDQRLDLLGLSHEVSDRIVVACLFCRLCRLIPLPAARM
jgi:Glu-tRNA(Gln) amidotransferase subunit E-like FAD-binding protein